MLTVTVLPGVVEKVESVSVGVASTMKVSKANAPLLLVTVTVTGPGRAPLATVKVAVIVAVLVPVTVLVVVTLVLMTQAGAGVPANRVAEADMMQFESRLGKPVPVTVTLVPGGPSEGERNIAGPTTGGATVKVAEAESPKVPLTVTVKLSPDATPPTTKNVPVSEVPPEPIRHAASVKRPAGVEVNEQRTEPIVSSPLLN